MYSTVYTLLYIQYCNKFPRLAEKINKSRAPHGTDSLMKSFACASGARISTFSWNLHLDLLVSYTVLYTVQYFCTSTAARVLLQQCCRNNTVATVLLQQYFVPVPSFQFLRSGTSRTPTPPSPALRSPPQHSFSGFRIALKGGGEQRVL